MVFYRLAATILLINAIASDASPNFVQRDLESDDKNLKPGDFFFEPNGDWFLGVLGSDDINLGGAKSRVKVGLITSANAPIGNLYEGISTADGIMGLNPGQFGNGSLESNNTDVITTLVKSNVITRHVFTMCITDHPHDPKDAGKMYLGPPQHDFDVEMEIPLNMTKSYGGYQIEFPTDVLSVPLKIGDETLVSFSETDWNDVGVAHRHT